MNTNFVTFVSPRYSDHKNLLIKLTHNCETFYTVEPLCVIDLVYGVYVTGHMLDEYRRGLLPDGFFVKIFSDFFPEGVGIMTVDEKHYQALELV